MLLLCERQDTYTSVMSTRTLFNIYAARQRVVMRHVQLMSEAT